jgi:isoleucyl-tRNA synthetase
LLEASENLLREQTNVTEVKFVTDPKEMPVNVTVKPNFELLAPKVKNRMNEVSAKLAKVDGAWLFSQFEKEGKMKLPDLNEVELTESDVIFSFASADPKYVVVENFGIVVALDTSRDSDLIARGLVKDIARNVQALRKEKGFNPTDVLELVKISRLGEQNTTLATPMLDELAFLVRVKKAEVYPGVFAGDETWNSGELDGTQIKIEIS